jgi:Spy/CpxP family protein refolding chaperone
MKRSKLILPSLIGFLALGGVALGGMALAQDTGQYNDAPEVQAQGRTAKASQRMTQKLDLDSSQQALFEQGQAKLIKKGKRLRKKMKSMVQEREQAMNRGDFDTLHELIDQQAALRSKMAHARLDAMQPFTESLSGQQREELQTMLKKRHQARRGRGGPPGQRGAKRGGRGRGQNRGRPCPQWEE